MSKRLRNFVFTWNNYPEDHHSRLKEKREIAFIVYQEEVGENGTPHLQGYIELKNQTAFSKVRKWFKWHIEKRLGSQQEAIDYCSKSDTKVGETRTWGKKKCMGSRTDIQNAYEALKTGSSLLKVAEEAPLVHAKYFRAMQNYKGLLAKESTKEFRAVNVLVLWGEAGTGKTRYAYDNYKEVYALREQDGQIWWDGYEGEECLLIDDFYGWMPWGLFLSTLDGHPQRLNVKGGHTYAGWTTVIITSNQEPEKWYPKKGAPKELIRRINEIREFPQPRLAGKNKRC